MRTPARLVKLAGPTSLIFPPAGGSNTLTDPETSGVPFATPRVPDRWVWSNTIGRLDSKLASSGVART